MIKSYLQTGRDCNPIQRTQMLTITSQNNVVSEVHIHIFYITHEHHEEKPVYASGSQ